MDKKKILIFSHAMELGGAEKALLGLLETIDTTKYEVDLFLMKHSGEWLKEIPDRINLLPEISQYADLAVPIMNVLKKGHFRIAYGRYKGKKAAAKKVAELDLRENDVGLEYSHKYTAKYMPQVNDKEYDLAISFLTPHYFVANKVQSKKKIAWIHTDYQFVACDTESQLKMWQQYDNIISISDDVTKSFLVRFPALKDKIVMIENILPENYIERLTNAYSVEREMPDDCIKLLSIGRFCTAKNFDNVPEICSKIIKNGIDVKWYLIGYGGDEQLIRDKTAEFSMQKYVIMLGKKENPYPYIKACDIYVQPSRYEGRCVSVTEAQLLHKPVVITNYATSSSQLTDGYDGVIVPMDNEGCAEGILKVIKDKELQSQLIENTKKNDYSNNNEIDKIYRIIEDRGKNETTFRNNCE